MRNRLALRALQATQAGNQLIALQTQQITDLNNKLIAAVKRKQITPESAALIELTDHVFAHEGRFLASYTTSYTRAVRAGSARRCAEPVPRP